MHNFKATLGKVAHLYLVFFVVVAFFVAFRETNRRIYCIGYPRF